MEPAVELDILDAGWELTVDTHLVLQLRIIACFSMCDGGGDLMLASPSRPVPYEGGGEYGARQKA